MEMDKTVGMWELGIQDFKLEFLNHEITDEHILEENFMYILPTIIYGFQACILFQLPPWTPNH